MDINELLEQDAETRVASETDLAAIAALAEEQLDCEARVLAIEKALDAAKKTLEKIQTQRLPELMKQASMSEFKLRDGRRVTIKPETYVSVAKDRRPVAFEWLRQHGEAGVIKNVVSVEFGKDQDSNALSLLDKLAEQGYDARQKEDVHAGTLKALIKRRIEAGLEVDMQLFGVHQVDMATVK